VAKGGSSSSAGGAAFEFDREKMVAAASAGAGDGTLRILLEIQEQIRQNLSKPGGGVKYPGRKYTSSAPGQAPAAQTGSLRNSWQTGKPDKKIEGSRISWAVGSALPYARLEFGYGRALPRPYAGPAVESVRPRAMQIMNAYVNAAMKKAFPGMKAP